MSELTLADWETADDALSALIDDELDGNADGRELDMLRHVQMLIGDKLTDTPE